MRRRISGKNILFNIGACLLFAALGALLAGMCYVSGEYPAGSDTLGYLYRGKNLYREICAGNFYPLFDSSWYNGVEMLRMNAPLPLYLLAGATAVFKGNEMNGYLLYMAGLSFVGAWSFYRLGVRLERRGLGLFLGAIWTFMPSNVYTLFEEGNLARGLAVVFLPWMIYNMYSYIARKRVVNLVGIMLLSGATLLCDPLYLMFVLMAAFLFSILAIFTGTRARKVFHCFLSILLGCLLCSVWLIPALNGGILQQSLHDGTKSMQAIGWVSICVMAVGLLGGKKKPRTYFGMGLILLFLSQSFLYPFLSALPLGEYWRAAQFTALALAMCFFGFLLWDSLKGWIIGLVCVALMAEVCMALPNIYGGMTAKPVEERLGELASSTLLDQAKELTRQRLALLDNGILESAGAYVSSEFGGRTDLSFGYGWQTANTADNIMLLNQAMENGAYTYLFDRCLKLGNDTVLVANSQLKYGSSDMEKLTEAAERVGYEEIWSTVDFSLYHIETPENFGVISEYPAIGIGDATKEFSLWYPFMKETDSANLNDYTFEELNKYRLIYLDGFTYSNKEKAEEMLRNLADAGVRIVISASGVPIDENTGVQSFLGVICQGINFTNGFPIWDTVLGEKDPTFFPGGYTKWRTVYLEGLTKCYGSVEELGKKLEFMGTAGNDNIVYLGFGLPFYYSLTLDASAEGLINLAMGEEGFSLPENRIVPLQVSVKSNKLFITSEYDNVNTTLSYHDIYQSEQKLMQSRNLLYVNSGTTRIDLKFPYHKEGMISSIVTLLITIVLLVWIRSLWRKRAIDSLEIFGIQKPFAEKQPKNQCMVPDGAKYRVKEAFWTTQTGEKIPEEEYYSPGKVFYEVLVQAAEDEKLDPNLTATMNSFAPDEIRWLDETSVQMKLSFFVAEPFRFLKQPEGGSAPLGTNYDLHWEISQDAKVGYLQVKELDNWIIADVVPENSKAELTYHLQNDIIEAKDYRIIYILNNGQTMYSEEFRVDWLKGKQK